MQKILAQFEWIIPNSKSSSASEIDFRLFFALIRNCLVVLYQLEPTNIIYVPFAAKQNI